MRNRSGYFYAVPCFASPRCSSARTVSGTDARVHRNGIHRPADGLNFAIESFYPGSLAGSALEFPTVRTYSPTPVTADSSATIRSSKPFRPNCFANSSPMPVDAPVTSAQGLLEVLFMNGSYPPTGEMRATPLSFLRFTAFKPRKQNNEGLL
jgi:hypothetical protein